MQDIVQQAVAKAVSSRDDDLVTLHQQLDESEAHFQAELDEAHAQLLASQEVQHKLEQQLRDSEAKRWVASCCRDYRELEAFCMPTSVIKQCLMFLYTTHQVFGQTLM